MVYQPGPRTPDGGQTGPVGDAKHPADFVFEHVGRPIPAVEVTDPGQVVVRETAGPHHFSPRFVVGRVSLERFGLVNHRLHQGFGNPIGRCH